MTTLVFDTEGNGLLDTITKMWCIVITDIEDLDKQYKYGPDQLKEGLAHLKTADTVVCHNILGYDIPVLKKLFKFRFLKKTKIIDTAVMSRLLRSDRPLPAGCSPKEGTHSIKAWALRFGMHKPEIEDWSEWSEDKLDRCAADVAINALTYLTLLDEMKAIGLNYNDAMRTEHQAAVMITQQEINGVPFDVDSAYTLRAELQIGIKDIDEELVPHIPRVPLPQSKQPTWPSKQFKKDGTPTAAALKYYGAGFNKYRTDIIVKDEPINLSSDKQVKDYLLSIGWVPTEWNYKKGKDGKPLYDEKGKKTKTSPKLTEDSYESLADNDLGAKISLRLKMAHRLSLLEGLLTNLRYDGRLSASAIPMGTPTSRMTHRVVVNIPSHSYLGKELRDLFTTVPGYTRVGIDLKACQLRGLGHYISDPEYTKVLVEGTKENDDDQHCYARDLAGLKDRDAGKKFNYSMLFGAMDARLARDLTITVEEAAVARKKFFEGMPELPKLLKRLMDEWELNGYLKGLDGRAIWVRAKHMLLVYLLQDLEAIVMKNFMVFVHEGCIAAKIDMQLVTTMHDEVQFLVKDEQVELFKTICNEAIDKVNNKFKLNCPQGIDILTGDTWAECH